MNKTNKPETYMERVDGEQVKKTIEGYQQNAEQNESTLWKRVQDKKGNE
jgi:ribosomal protein L18E